MNKIILDKEREYKNIYFIGIGGVHMNGMAQILFDAGYNVFGSDQKKSEVIEYMEKKGIKIFIGHKKENIGENIDLVIYTAAVRENNPELMVAKEKGIKTLSRAKALGLIMKNYKYPILVSGTHGKTTVTNMTSEIFLKAKKNPTILSGGKLKEINDTLVIGGDDYFISEACEYTDSFLNFFPYCGIILNIELDHTDYFKDINQIRNSFKAFAELVPEDGFIIINSEIDNYKEIVEKAKGKVITLGTENSDAQWKITDLTYDKEGKPSFNIYKDKEKVFSTGLNVYGGFNGLNALAAIVAADCFGLEREEILNGIESFSGVKRRLEHMGYVNEAIVVDDYAHHPTEIKSAFEAVGNAGFGKIYSVFQPHTYSRTKALLNDFAEAFDNADVAIIVDVYSPMGREEKEEVHSKDIVELIEKRGKTKAVYMPDFKSAENYLRENAIPNDLLITMGAGNVYEIAENLLK